MSSFIIRKAERRKAKLRLALTGVSGSGKTFGAITLASGMSDKIIVIDTEHRSADIFSDIAKYDVLELQAPFSPERYVEAIHSCEKAGYEVIIIDSLSHEWAGDGGVLDMQTSETEASKNKNSYIAWGKVTPKHNALVNAILQSPCHIIATMRSKTAYEMVDDSNGKKRPVKMGLAPIQREGMDYEFTVVLDIDKESKLYTTSKDRTRLFEGKPAKITVETGKNLMAWLMDGKSVEEIENEQVDSIKTQVFDSQDYESVKALCRKGIDLFPNRREEFVALATQRQSHFIPAEVH